MRNILIAGGCGFVGSGMARQLKIKYPEYRIVALDNLHRRGAERNVPLLLEAGIHFVHGDIRNKSDLVFEERFDTIIDAAAEPSALAGISGPVDYVIETNFNGTVNLLGLAVDHRADFIFLSTSRVYPVGLLEQLRISEGDTRFTLDPVQQLPGCSVNGITEDFPLVGARTFYGSSKLAAELMIREFATFSGLKAVINRCGVIAGPGQMGKTDQGVVVLWMARHYWKKPLQYIGYGGTGKQVRDILHIDDLSRLVDMQIHRMDHFAGKLYNAGGGNTVSISLQELTRYCEFITGNRIEIAGISANRPGDIPLYITDYGRLSAETGWHPEKKVNEILTDIYTWIQQDEKNLKPILAI